jgi:hypothetical protein
LDARKTKLVLRRNGYDAYVTVVWGAPGENTHEVLLRHLRKYIQLKYFMQAVVECNDDATRALVCACVSNLEDTVRRGAAPVLNPQLLAATSTQAHTSTQAEESVKALPEVMPLYPQIPSLGLRMDVQTSRTGI